MINEEQFFAHVLAASNRQRQQGSRQKSIFLTRYRVQTMTNLFSKALAFICRSFYRLVQQLPASIIIMSTNSYNNILNHPMWFQR